MTTAVVVAAGAGTRMGGDVPKAFRLLAGRPLVCYSLATLEQCTSVERVVVVVPESHLHSARVLTALFKKRHAVVAGGAHRQDSVLNGLNACPDDGEWVAVHDAARPFATVELFERVIEVAKTHGQAIAASRVEDTLKRCDGDRIVQTLDRSNMWRAQTPQVFRRDALARALHECGRLGVHVTDEAEAMERIGESTRIVDGGSDNLKLTTLSDWRLAAQIIENVGHS